MVFISRLPVGTFILFPFDLHDQTARDFNDQKAHGPLRATLVAKKTLSWKKNNSKPNPAEICAEIRRLQSLRASHETLQDVSTL
jgi:hypothetical protein